MLSMKKLKRHYKTENIVVKGLNGVSFDVQQGEFAAILGPSGCAKITLVRILALLDSHTDGDYSIKGLEVANLPEKERSFFRLTKVGYVFQDYALMAEMIAVENVEIQSIMGDKSLA